MGGVEGSGWKHVGSGRHPVTSCLSGQRKLPFGGAEAWIGSQMTEVARLRGSRVGDEGVGVARTGERICASSDA
jgi:hypothetical protein